MANVRLFGETSGFVELAAPNAAGNNTITLPTTGTELVASDGTGSTTLAGTVTASGLTVENNGTVQGSLTVDGTSTFAVGASGTPAIAASGDANTGIYFPAADTIGFAEGGNEAGRFDSSGRLLIGTSSARSNFFASVASQLQIEGTTSPNSALSLTRNSNDASCALLYFAKSRAGSVGGNNIVASGDQLGIISWQGADGTTLRAGAAIEARVDGTPGASDMPTRLMFSTTADGASTPTERMRIHESGKVSIRTTSIQNQAELTLSAPLNSGDATLSCTVGLTAGTVDTVVFRDNSGNNCGTINVNAGTNTTSYNTSSDYRLKENVVPLTGAIERLNQLQVKRFNFISEPETVLDGFLAHEAQEVVPECATHSKDAVDADGNPIYQGIDQSKLVPLLTAALQEAIAKIETLETTNASLEARLTALESA